MGLKMLEILRGDIWLFDPDPIRGKEVGTKLRPVLIMSNDSFNNGPAGLLIIVPLTTKEKKIPCHVLITPKDGGVKEACFAMSEQLRSISKERLITKWGHMNNKKVIRQIGEWIGSLLSLDEYY
ncbi:MAG: type II toxin-antitoxin system PemK/MazF family toxin [Chlamydiia bacterium]|nr:type II toxin-antitoxin system PemK/MazF family toxin [Chlamydiia bacterium]